MLKPALCLAAALAAAPAFADPNCSGTPMSLPMWQVAKGFEEAGGAIREMKVSDGCYEIYGKNGETKLEIYYDPATGAELQREED
ncbi:PepSY domain-containing protein [Amaricoccus sp.]|uniref:PepSY domain-containing protein n=1 Tax=Amaricoccus sp. TaxID=1872485 RepID=UPI001B452306|nr:PepSY domain-containing protein [Amaricoccus sp.]MBP7000328.1 PepSY domain-containing protein [Amaricoccus sp.]